MAFIMTSWIDNGTVLKSSSQWQLNDFLKLNNSGHWDFKMSKIQCITSCKSHPIIIIIKSTRFE